MNEKDPADEGIPDDSYTEDIEEMIESSIEDRGQFADNDTTDATNGRFDHGILNLGTR